LSIIYKLEAIACHPGPSGEGLAAVVKENLVEIPVVIIPNHAPTTISLVFLDKSGAYKHRYKSGAVRAAPNIVCIAHQRKSVAAAVLLRSCGTLPSLLDSPS